MKRFSTLALVAALVPAIGLASTSGIKAGKSLIRKIGQNKVTVTKTFQAPGGFIGYVVAPKGSARGSVVFTDASGQYMFAGPMFGPNGQNLTEGYTQQYVLGPLNKAAYASVQKMNWFTEGKSSAPRKAYIAIDPNCIYCHLLYERIEHYIQDGELQVRWLPVGVIKPTSMGKSAQLMLPQNNAKRVELLKKDEDAFQVKTEEGALQPLSRTSKKPGVAKAFKQVEENNVLFTKYQYVGTPVVLYRNKNGEATAYPGYPRGAALKTLINDIGNKW